MKRAICFQAEKEFAKNRVKSEVAKKGSSILYKLQSTIILFILLAVISTILWITWGIILSICHSIDEKCGANNIRISKTSVSIGIKYRSKESVVDSAEQYAHRAWKGLEIAEDTRIHSFLKLHHWKDRKRHVYQGSGTEAANSGW